jgi:cytochrome c oxidase subunit 1
VVSYRKYKANPVDIGPDPWDARSLEWSIPSPTPAHNFDVEPTVEFQDDWWHQKWGTNEEGKIVRKAYPEDIAQDGSATDVHLPSPSYMPIVLAAALPFIAYSIIFTFWLLIPAGVLFLAGFLGWALEPADDPEAAHGHHDHDVDDHDGAEPADAVTEGASNV